MKKFFLKKLLKSLLFLLPLLFVIYVYFIDFFDQDLNLFFLGLVFIEGAIIFQVYSLIRELNPKVNHYHGYDYEPSLAHKNTDYCTDDIELDHLQHWFNVAHELGIDEYKVAFSRLIDNYVLSQKNESRKKQDGDDRDGDILA